MALYIFALTVVGGVVGALLARFYPEPARQQIFAAVMATVGSILVMARPTNHDSVWFYVAATIAVSMGTFLIMAWMHRPRTA
jgi:uncharacterized membrane protein YfcA